MIKIKRRKTKREIRINLSLSHGGDGILKEDRLVILCQCGCGEYAKPGNKYIIGHNGRGISQTQETKDKRANSLSKSWATDYKRKENQSIRMTGENNPAKKPGVGEKISKANTGRKPSKESIEKGRASLLKKYEDPEFVKMMSESKLKMWQDEDFRKRHAEAMKPVYESLEVRNKIGKTSKELWKTDDFREKHSGENNPNWQGGISGEPSYPRNWNGELKESIRIRDNYKCQVCSLPQNLLDRKLHIHHIDYNKDNCDKNNLISLCHSCHIKTNTDRDKWIEFFKLKIINKINEILISYLPVHQIIKGNENYRTGV
jgi:5-methylcytosine-specific restriction endonuclease McrA